MMIKAADLRFEIIWHDSEGGDESTFERFSIDISSFKEKPEDFIPTAEYRKNGESVEAVKYKPRVDFKEEGDFYIFQLKYRPVDHPNLVGRGVIWGVLTIKVNKLLEEPLLENSVSIYWCSDNKKEGGSIKLGKEDYKCWIEKPSETKMAYVQIRKAQDQFKKKLEKLGKRCCAITKESCADVLDAAHIYEVKHGGSDEPENGIFLRADLHRLYDAGYFTIEPDGKLTLEKNLPRYCIEDLTGKCLDETVASRIKPYLKRREQSRAADLESRSEKDSD